MQAPQSMNEAPRKQNRTLLIIAGIAIVLLCGCVVLAAAGFYSFTAIRRVETQVFPTEELIPSFPEDLATPSSDSGSPTDVPSGDTDLGEPPAGGLGNDILRGDTWQYVAAAAVGEGCDQPVGADSTIEVLQQPDASGVWVEKWTVACNSGESYAYEVEYVLDATGATFNIKSLP